MSRTALAPARVAVPRTYTPDPARLERWVRESRASQGLAPHATPEQFDKVAVLLNGWTAERQKSTQSGTKRSSLKPDATLPTGMTVTDRNTADAKARARDGSPADHSASNLSKVGGSAN